MPIWRKVSSDSSNDTAAGQTKKHSNPHPTQWSDHMISSHVPIYSIHRDANEHHQYSVPPILFDAISPSIYCVLLGESTHGTKEFYELRSAITKHLILHKGFTCVFIEEDWPKAYRLNQYVCGTLEDPHITLDALFDDIKTYPLWMYRNQTMKELVVWLRQLNIKLQQNHQEMVTFYGIDMQCYDSLQSLKSTYRTHQSVLPNSSQMLSFLNAISVNYHHCAERKYTAKQIQKIYQLFLSSRHGMSVDDSGKYGALMYNIDQNFMTLKAALHYYNNDCGWNIRDNHWFHTMEKYFEYKSNGKYIGYRSQTPRQSTKGGKIILWAHNSHVCNSDFTNYSYTNIGSIVKNRYGESSVFTICFDTFEGSVTATNHRKESPQFFNLQQNVHESYGKLWHKWCGKWNENELMIVLKHGMDKMEDMNCQINPVHMMSVKEIKKKEKIRDIGVCYLWKNPYHHCSNGNLLQLADVMIFVDKSNALEPFQCDKHPTWDRNKELWQQKNQIHKM